MPVRSMRKTSSRRLASERNSVSRNVMSTIHLLSMMPEASPPASMRSTKPKAIMHTSIMANRFSQAQ